jgi:hypothetical protein
MQGVKDSARNPASDRVAAQSEFPQLVPGYHSMLFARQPSDRSSDTG